MENCIHSDNGILRPYATHCAIRML